MTPSFSSPPPSEAPPKKINLWWIVVIVLIVLCCCCVVFGVLAWNFGDQILEAILEALTVPSPY